MLAPGLRQKGNNLWRKLGVLLPWQYCWGTRTIISHPPRDACFSLGSKAAAACALWVSEEATSRENALSASPAPDGMLPSAHRPDVSDAGLHRVVSQATLLASCICHLWVHLWMVPCTVALPTWVVMVSLACREVSGETSSGSLQILPSGLPFLGLGERPCLCPVRAAFDWDV